MIDSLEHLPKLKQRELGRISKEDLSILAGSVKEIIQRTVSLCRNKIADINPTDRKR